MLKKYSFLAFLLRHYFTLCIVWILSLLVFKLSVTTGSVVILLILLSLFASFFTFLELYYYLRPATKLHAIVKCFYYVVFALSLLFPIYYVQRVWGFWSAVIFFSAFILLLFFIPFLIFRLSFAAFSASILAYLCLSMVVGFQNIQLFLFLVLLMVTVYCFLRYAILNIDSVVLMLRKLFKKQGYDVSDLDSLLGFRSFSSKFLLLHGYLKDVCKLDKVLKSYIDVGSLAGVLDFVNKILRVSKAKDIREFLLSLPPQIKDVRNIMVHGARINLYRGERCEHWDRQKQRVLKSVAHFLYWIYLAEIYPLYLQLFYGIRDKVVEYLPMRS